MIIFAYIVLAIFAIYLLGCVITVAFNWTKLQISSVLSILWFVFLLPERRQQ